MAKRDGEFEAASERAAQTASKNSGEAQRERRANPLAKQWQLSDDPVERLPTLPAGSNWILFYNPADAKQAADWLQRGLDGMQPEPASGDDPLHAREPAHVSALTQARASLKLQAREAIPTGTLRVLPAD
ncbi:MAG TPA: hypothetical protein PK177_17735 [Burkholderiaceae bacterium]|nr:hypothetical protein [Burkholderiaceae bacterium]